MDPNHREGYAEAQTRLRELFNELSQRGGVGPAELQRELLPFTAGDVRRDLLAMIDELTRRRVVLDEHEFVRTMWRKMYLPHMLFAEKLTAGMGGREADNGGDASASTSTAVNVPFAHVLVSLKRRSQMQQFADYYMSRGISGADYLTSASSAHRATDTSARSPAERKQRRESLRLASIEVTTSAVGLATALQLRQRRSSTYDVVACVFDGSERVLKTHVVRKSVRFLYVRAFSSLYVLLFCSEDGSFALGSTYFAEKAQSEFHDALDRYNTSEAGARYPVRPVKVEIPTHSDARSVMAASLADLGLCNVTAVAATKRKVVVAVGRKLLLWESQEPLRAFTAQLHPRDLPPSSDDTFGSILSTESAEEFEMNANGDFLGLLGGSKLLGRTKTLIDLASVTLLAVDDTCVLAQTSKGDLYSWQRSTSSNALVGSGAAAESPTDQATLNAIRLPLQPASVSEQVRRIACGRRHALAMSSSGAVFVWGTNEFGQLGLGHDTPILDRFVDAPTRVDLSVQDEDTGDTRGVSAPTVCKALDVACGNDHSLVLTTDGQVLVFGCHWYGQLGLGEDGAPESSMLIDGCCYLPTRLVDFSHDNGDTSTAPATALDQAYLITAQGDSSAAVNTRGDVFQWGKCVPSGTASVCGLVSRWRPEQVIELNGATGVHAGDEQHQRALPSWHSIAIAHGVLVLARHTES